MATEEAPKPAGPRGPKKKVDVVDEPRSDAFKYLPYGAVVLAVIGLIATITRSPAHAVHAAAVLLVGGILGLGYVAWQDAHSLPPDDNFHKLVPVATGFVVLGLLATVAITLFPPSPLGTVTLQRAGDSATITVQGSAANLIFEASGQFEPDADPSARASYVMHLTRGGAEEDIEGAFERSSGSSPLGGGTLAGSAATESTANRHWLKTLHGPGRYTVTLDRMPDNLRPPVRGSLRAEPFSSGMLMAAFGLLALVALAIDAGIAKRGVEPSYAPALFVPLVLVYYLHGHFAGTNIGEALFASFLVGLLAGGLGGEVLARVFRKILG